MRRRMAIWALICLLILGGCEAAEARDDFYIRFSIVLGGVAAGGAGLFLFFTYGTDIAAYNIPVGNALVTLQDQGLKWDVPELVIRTPNSLLTGPQGIEGYACLFRVRFP